MNPVRDEIAKNILFYRKSHGLTQKQLAEKLGVKSSAVSNWENGANSIDIDTLHTACTIFGVSINDMFGKFANVSISIPPRNTPEETQLLTNYRTLNEEGQELLAGHADTLVLSGKYKKSGELGMAGKKQA